MSNEYKDWIWDITTDEIIKWVDQIIDYKRLSKDDWLFHCYYLNRKNEKIYNVVKYNNGIQAYCIEGKEQNNAK